MNRKYNVYDEDTKKFVKTEVLEDSDARHRSSQGYMLEEVYD